MLKTKKSREFLKVFHVDIKYTSNYSLNLGFANSWMYTYEGPIIASTPGIVEGHKSGNIKDTKLVKCRASTIQGALSS